METLVEILTAPANKERAVADCVALVESEVASKRGLSGAAVKTAFSIVKKVKPGFVADVIEKLLPAFACALQPIFEESQGQAGDGELRATFEEVLRRDPERTAEALLQVTDSRIDGARPAIQKTYGRLRKGARGHVEAAVPALSRALARYV